MQGVRLNVLIIVFQILVQMGRTGKEKVVEEPSKKHWRTSKRKELEAQVAMSLVAPESRRGQGHGTALRRSERQTRSARRQVLQEESQRICPEGTPIPEYTPEQVRQMKEFRENNPNYMIAPAEFSPAIRQRQGPRTRGGSTSAITETKRSRSSKVDELLLYDFRFLSLKKI